MAITGFSVMLQQYEQELQRLQAEQIWTDIQEVILGQVQGNGIVVPVPADQRKTINEVYYRSLDGTQSGTCIDTRSDQRANRHVKVGYPPGETRLHVYDVVVTPDVDPVANEIGVSPHAEQHSLRNLGYAPGNYQGKVGQDPSIIDARQLWDLSLQPWSGMVAHIPRGWYQFGSVLHWWPGYNVQDMTAYVPVIPGMGRHVLIEITREFGVSAKFGAPFQFQYATLTDYLPAKDANHYFVGYLLLVYGMDEITWAHIRGGGAYTAQPDVPQLIAIMNYKFKKIYDLIHMLHNP